MIRRKLVFFALKTNAAVFGFFALWLFGVHTLMAGHMHTRGFLTWGFVALSSAAVQLVAARGLRKQKTWAWMLTTLLALCNLWLGIMCTVTLSSKWASYDLLRQVGAAGAVFYFAVAGLTILLGLYLGKADVAEEASTDEH